MSVVSIHGRNAGAFAKSVLHQLLERGDVAAELEAADGEPEPDEGIDGAATVLDFGPPKRVGWAPRIERGLALSLLLVTVPHLDGRADQAPAITRPLSAAEAPQQGCRICRKGRPCGDGCISSTKQCRKKEGCACSAASGS
jgi:hypothetical protein